MKDVLQAVGLHARRTGANVEIYGSENTSSIGFDSQLRTAGMKFTHMCDAGLASQVRDTLHAYFVRATSLLCSGAYRKIA